MSSQESSSELPMDSANTSEMKTIEEATKDSRKSSSGEGPSEEPPKKEFSHVPSNVIEEEKTKEKEDIEVIEPNFEQTLSRKQFWLVFAGLMLGLLLSSLDQTIVSTATPVIVNEFTANGDGEASKTLDWITVAYLLTSTALSPSIGRFADIFGRRNTYMAVVAVFFVGSILCGFAQNMVMLIIARAVQGIGGGGVGALVFTILADIVSLRERGKYSGLFGLVFSVSSVAGPLLGGVFTDKLNWRWVFFINLPIAAITEIVIWFGLPNKTDDSINWKKDIDYFGTITIVSSVICLLLALTWGGSTYPWSDALIICLLVGAIAFLIIFVFIELRYAKLPIIPMRFFLSRNVTLCAIMLFLMGFGMFGSLTFIPVYFQHIYGISATDSGLHMLPLMAGLIVGSLVSGALVTRTGHYKIFPIFGTASTTVGIGLLYLYRPDSTLALQLGLLVPIGLGIGVCLQNLTLIGQNSVSAADTSVVTASLTFFRTIGGVIGVTVFQSLLLNETVVQKTNPANFGTSFSPLIMILSSLDRVFLYMVGFVGVAFIASLFIKQEPLRTTTGAHAEPAV